MCFLVIEFQLCRQRKELEEEEARKEQRKLSVSFKVSFLTPPSLVCVHPFSLLAQIPYLPVNSRASCY